MTAFLNLRIPAQGEPTGVWQVQIGSVYHPLRLFDGTRWRVFADAPGYETSIPKPNPGGPLMLRRTDGIWALVSREGYSWGTITGRVFDFNGVLLPNRTVTAFAGRQLDTGVTDANGMFTLIGLPIDIAFGLVTYWVPGSETGGFSTTPLPLTATDDNPHLTYDVHLPIVT